MKTTWFFPVSLMIWPYLIAPLFISYFETGIGSHYFTVYALLTPVILLVSILFACFYRKNHAEYDFAFWNMIIKLIHIPFYLAIFVFGFAAMIAIPLLFIIDVALMLASSSYGISALIRMYKRDGISLEYMIINMVCHLLFCLDVISAVILYRRMKRVKP